jgi:hypothetical protein
VLNAARPGLAGHQDEQAPHQGFRLHALDGPGAESFPRHPLSHRHRRLSLLTVHE